MEFLDLLDEFCDQDWLEAVRSELYMLARSRVLHWNMLPGGCPESGYDAAPDEVVGRPLLRLDDYLTKEAIEKEDALYEKAINLI